MVKSYNITRCEIISLGLFIIIPLITIVIITFSLLSIIGLINIDFLLNNTFLIILSSGCCFSSIIFFLLYLAYFYMMGGDTGLIDMAVLIISFLFIPYSFEIIDDKLIVKKLFSKREFHINKINMEYHKKWYNNKIVIMGKNKVTYHLIREKIYYFMKENDVEIVLID